VLWFSGRADTRPLHGDGTGRAAWDTWSAATPIRPTASPRPSASPTITPSPTVTPIERCGRGYCVVITPTATVNAGIGTDGGGASTQGSSRCDLLDPGTWLPCFVAAGIDLVTGWVRTIVTTQMFADVWGSTNVLLTVENPVVVRYYTAIRLASDLLLALFAMGVFGEILVCQRAHQTYHHAVEKIWRLILIAFLSNMSLAVIAQAVDLSNIMTGGVWGVQSSGLDAVMAHTDPGSAVVVASIFELANEVMLLLLFVQMVMRLALLDVLIVLSPLGLLCYGWGPRKSGGSCGGSTLRPPSSCSSYRSSRWSWARICGPTPPTSSPPTAQPSPARRVCSTCAATWSWLSPSAFSRSSCSSPGCYARVPAPPRSSGPRWASGSCSDRGASDERSRRAATAACPIRS